MRHNCWILFGLLTTTFVMAFAPAARGQTVIPGLLGGDLTDPENDGDPEADVNYNATFASDDEPGFGGGEHSFNVFDNQVGGGNMKWCCNDASPGNPVNGPGFQLDATLDAGPHFLTHFTLTSSNDTPARDPSNFQILGSNDGTNFTPIYTATTTPFTDARNQTIRFDAGTDFPNQSVAYSTFRYSVTETVGGTEHALGEIEYFGTPVPEPTSIALLGIGAFALLARQRRNA